MVAIVLEAAENSDLPRRCRGRKSLAPRFQKLPAVWAQLPILQRGAFELPPARLGRQQAAAQRTVGITAQLQLAQRQVQSIFTTGEHVVLLVRHDKSISVKGPG